MPALAIAAQRVGFYPKVIHGSDNIFSFGLSDTAIVVHRAHPDDLHERFGAPQYEMNKLFDKPGDWDKLYFNIEQNSTEDETTHFSNPKHDQETRYHRNNHEGTDDSKVHGQTGDASLPIVV